MNYLVFLQGRRAFQDKCGCVMKARLKDGFRKECVALGLSQVIEIERYSKGIIKVVQLI